MVASSDDDDDEVEIRPIVVVSMRTIPNRETTFTTADGTTPDGTTTDGTDPDGDGVLAGAVGVNRTVVYRLVTTLEQHGLARRDAAGRMHVGLGVLALARGLQPVLREMANPVLRRLAEDLGATAHLTLADGGEALAIAVVEPSWTDFHVAYRVGARHPPLASPGPGQGAS